MDATAAPEESEGRGWLGPLPDSVKRPAKDPEVDGVQLHSLSVETTESASQELRLKITRAVMRAAPANSVKQLSTRPRSLVFGMSTAAAAVAVYNAGVVVDGVKLRMYTQLPDKPRKPQSVKVKIFGLPLGYTVAAVTAALSEQLGPVRHVAPDVLHDEDGNSLHVLLSSCAAWLEPEATLRPKVTILGQTAYVRYPGSSSSPTRKPPTSAAGSAAPSAPAAAPTATETAATAAPPAPTSDAGAAPIAPVVTLTDPQLASEPVVAAPPFFAPSRDQRGGGRCSGERKRTAAAVAVVSFTFVLACALAVGLSF